MIEFVSISSYDPSAAAWAETPTGVSMTIPGRALSVGEIYRRSVIGAPLPNIAFGSPLDDGADETMADAFDNDFDIIDAKDSAENSGYLYNRYVEQERAKVSSKSERVKQAEKADAVSQSETASESKEEKLFD